MGLFLKTVAQATIDFYSDFEVSVDCTFADTPDNDEKDKRLVYLVAFYYSKTLYNISNAPGAESLMEYVQNIYEDWKADFKNNPEREYRPKLPEQYAYLVDKRDAKAIKTFRADLNESRRGTYSISTKIPALEPNRYSPPSVVALIQYALNNLHEPAQTIFLVITLGAMNHYYKEQGNHTSMNQIMEAPQHGIQGASQLVAGLNR
ncbi:hypothetical protein A2933_02630 [Candidatus Nomurabacteria bacterium RIFCSPLOWO2_01_FULL_46_18]|uniref:Uncharacterized protein n=1 Tax=Candidatus Nomurabacteria bacterium RIFCSPLOWO2_01_FULL_46_18 TaxID=1801783 RepID=A0A1F6XBI6_9BACT|nr:MAG: hypothetical protein A2933_02630 [Candidatus Nomurabacteria bacterium RIFCSPLOWO2_01_FULL_46_18]